MSAANKFTTCQFILQKCDFANPTLAPNCVKSWCTGEPYGFGSCTTDFTGVPAACCGRADPEECMARFQQSQGYGVFADACLTLEDYIATCQASDPAFAKGSYAQQAACLCYDDDGTFDPAPWNNAVATCSQTGQVTHPTIWANIANNPKNAGICTNAVGAASGIGGGSTVSSGSVVSRTASPHLTSVQFTTTALTSAQTTATVMASTSAGAGSSAITSAAGQTTATTAGGSTAGGSTATASSSTSANTTVAHSGSDGLQLNTKTVFAGCMLIAQALIMGTL